MFDEKIDRTANNKSLELLKVKEAAEYLGIHADTLRRWSKSGKLKCYWHPISGYRLFKLADLKNILSRILLDEQ